MELIYHFDIESWSSTKDGLKSGEPLIIYTAKCRKTVMTNKLNRIDLDQFIRKCYGNKSKTNNSFFRSVVDTLLSYEHMGKVSINKIQFHKKLEDHLHMRIFFTRQDGIRGCEDIKFDVRTGWIIPERW